MKINGKKVELTAEEVASAVCPANMKWIISEIDLLGLPLASESAKLGPLT